MAPVFDVVTVGETMALLSSVGQEVSSGSRLDLSFGGSESNVAIGLARLGHRVAWVSALGADSFGDMIAGEISAEGVEVIVSRDPVRKTGLMVKTLSAGEQRLVSYYRSDSAASALSANDFDGDIIGNAQILHLTGITPALSDATRDLARQAARIGKTRGVLVSLDLNYRPALWGEEVASGVLADLVANSDIVFGSPGECALVVGPADSSKALARKMSRRGPSCVVVKDGEHGAGMLIDGEWFTQPAIPVAVVDTVGAGDGFVAGFLSDLVAGGDPASRLYIAAVTGALCCTHAGDWQGFPSSAQLGEFLERNLV